MKHTAMLAFALMLLVTACGGDKQEQQKDADQHEMMHDEQAASFYCPMKCEGEKTYAEMGSCPVCGMDLVETVDTTEGDSHEGHDHGDGDQEGHSH